MFSLYHVKILEVGQPVLQSAELNPHQDSMHVVCMIHLHSSLLGSRNVDIRLGRKGAVA